MAACTAKATVLAKASVSISGQTDKPKWSVHTAEHLSAAERGLLKGQSVFWMTRELGFGRW